MQLLAPKPAEWQGRFQFHRARLLAAYPGAPLEHIGSTAIPDIYAKDVVDILVGVPADEIPATAQAFRAAGYGQEGQKGNHIWLCWPNPQRREAVIHIMEFGGETYRKRLAFRDYLRKHPAEAKAYEALKLRLAAQTDDWGEYTAQKADFVARILHLGKDSDG